MAFDPRQIRLFALFFAVSVMVVGALWYFVLRTEFVPVYENIRESDASKIVAELEEAGITYELSNNGHDILVPKGQSADARVAVAGANLALGGTTGFELFNENELSLTEFAQKINLQRAIQGELARTIMMMDGVEFARVHLAMPERTLFRAEQEAPTAAVTVEMRAELRLSEARVAGIRQLVSSSVPGLAAQSVAVLDDRGALMSAQLRDPASASGSAQTERDALEALVTIRAKDALAEVLPQQPVEVTVSAFERIARDREDEASETDGAQTAARIRPLGLGERALRVMIRTPNELGPEERQLITETLVEALSLSNSEGDVIDFTVGAISTGDDMFATNAGSEWADPTPSDARTAPAAASGDWSNAIGSASGSAWLIIPIVLLLLALLAVRPRRKLSPEQTEDFAELLRSGPTELEAR